MHDGQRFFGVYRGVVFDNRDKTNKGRVRVTIPQIMGSAPTEWAWPMETSQLKLGVPDVGQGVWVMFEGGDPHYPVWSGVFGKYKGAGNPLSVSPATSGTTLDPHIVLKTEADGSTSVDVLATLNALGQSITALSGGGNISSIPFMLNWLT